MKEFTTLAYLLSFPGMIAAVIMLTQFTKKMFDRIGKNKTKYVVFTYSLIFCIVAGAFQGKFTTSSEILETCLIWTVNSVIVWFSAMKAFEAVSGSTDGTLYIDTSDPNKDTWRLDLGDELEKVADKTSIKLNIDPNARLSR